MAELHPRPFIPFMVAAAGIGTFSLMDVAMKDLALSIGTYNAVMWRNCLGALFMGLLFIGTRQKWPPAHILKIHLWRGMVASVMSISFFWSLTKLPFAEAIGLSFIAPVIALYLAAVMLGETIGREAIWASLAGLGGVVIIMAGRLSGQYTNGHLWGAAAVLFSAVVFAYNLILARKQAQVAGPIEIAFFQNLFVAATLSFAAPWFLQPIGAAHTPLIGGAAILSIISLLLLSWAYARAEAQILIPVEYTAFVWAALFGWLFFAEPVTVPVLLGTVLIVSGSLIAARAKPEPVNQVEIAAV
ncbi:RhaT Permeases of the drug/metabolite transporter (DMT) superfamily [Sphingomonadaceae bacterium]|jgi:S-adenosylmethionine uptake transporter|uniref:DMT family transporter n=1 Tax=Sphingorhabdus sp. TaxID=1902408 RepID=UPI00273E290F|nr:DMT family transporter [Sphingorhabdus sp.]MCF8493228.1 DMT family transporter [Sphingomonadaceae bacterium]MCF8497687.1 DMT family transporter [Sphingomonadaceae bacterium]MDP4757402.1 DMT family transporter [Sphingorhabdus sp.]MDP4872686.1 DMT family transporter [Sphingorhabdus sp.]MDP4927485.1 DMT family transporter [Sphingorhabdus sp.]